MTSKIVVNNIEADSGINTITFINEVTAPTFNGNIVGTAATFSGNVDIAGALTYEDVTNVDSVGIVTARSGIHVTGGNIGIGENNPQNSLHISGSTPAIRFADTGANGSAFSIIEDNNGLLKIRNDAGNSGTGSGITFEVDSAERLRITSGGESKFTVGTNKYVKFYAATHNDEADLGAGIAFSRPSDGADMLSGMFAHSNTGLGIAARDHITFLTGGTSNVSDTEERLRITSAGLIGIGTVSPSGPIHAHVASGTQRSYLEASAAHSFLRLKSGSTSYNSGVEFFSGASNIANINGLGAGGLQFEVNGSERVRIDSAGKVLVSGQAALTSTSLPHPIQVTAASDADAIAIIGRASDDISELSFYEADKTTNLGEIQYRQDHVNFRHRVGDIRFASGGVTERLRIKSNGVVQVANTAHGTDNGSRLLEVIGNGNSTAGFLIANNATSASGKCDITFAPSNKIAGAQIFCEAQEDFSTGANRTADLTFITRKDGTLSEKFRILSDGQFDTNGVRHFYAAFQLANNGYYYWDIPVPDEGGYGNSFRCECGYNHYYTTAYGAHRSAWISSRGTSTNAMLDQEQNHSQSGSWSFSKPNSTTFRVSKSAGSYGGSGYGFIHVRFNYF